MAERAPLLVARALEPRPAAQQGVDEELGSPVRIGEGRVGAPDRMRALDAATDVVIVRVEILTGHHVPEGAHRSASEPVVARTLVELGPDDRQLAVAGEAAELPHRMTRDGDLSGHEPVATHV